MGYDFDNDLAVSDAAAFRARLGRPDALPAAAGETQPMAADNAPLRHPDWSALRARFGAIHALRGALARDPAPARAAGSFAAAGESVLSACRTGTAVNPVYWANIKAPCAITGPVAVPPHAATED